MEDSNKPLEDLANDSHDKPEKDRGNLPEPPQYWWELSSLDEVREFFSKYCKPF